MTRVASRIEVPVAGGGWRTIELAELGLKSWKQKKWLDVPRLKS